MLHSKRILFAALACAVCAGALSTPASASAVKDEILMWIKDAEDKLEELSKATPEGKFAWRPAKGVRSVGEVYMHVASANYGLPGFVGVQPPSTFNFETFEKSMTKKADVTKALEESFDHMKGALEKMSDEDLDKPAEFFGMKTTARGAYLLLLSHAHEHLGQSIAYARMNNITPPWTAREMQAMKDKEAAAAKETKKD